MILLWHAMGVHWEPREELVKLTTNRLNNLLYEGQSEKCIADGSWKSMT